MGWVRPVNALRNRAVRVAGTVLATVTTVVGVGYALLPLAIRLLISALDLTMRAGVSLAASVGDGADLSTIALTVGKAALGALVSTRALAAFAALMLVSAAALYGLQRLLGLDEETEQEGESSR
jgi:hypothetical protein